jgi:hypothetical protein
MSKDVSGGGRRRRGQALERLLIAFVCLDPRLTAAYQATISEVAADEGNHQSPAADDVSGRITDRRQAAAGVVA